MRPRPRVGAHDVILTGLDEEGDGAYGENFPAGALLVASTTYSAWERLVAIHKFHEGSAICLHGESATSDV